MATVNDEILDAYIRHQTYLIRYAGGLRNRASELLRESETALSRLVLDYASQLEGIPLTSKRAKTALAAFSNELNDLRGPIWQQIQDMATDDFTSLAAQEAYIAAGAIEGAVPVVLSMQLPSTSQLNAIATSQPFEGRTLSEWLQRTKNVDSDRIARQMKIGITQGQTPTQVTRSVMGTAQLNRRDGKVRKAFNDLEAVFLTVSNGIQSESKQALYRENSDLIKEELFSATLDSRTTIECASNDGGTFKVGTGPMPPLHFRCRSTRVPYINPDNFGTRPYKETFEREMVEEFAEKNKLGDIRSRGQLPYGFKTKFDAFARKRVRDFTGKLPAKVTYNQWLKRQTTSFQEEVLGTTRAKMFRNGEISLDKFVAPSGELFTLDDLRRKGFDIPEIR